MVKHLKIKKIIVILIRLVKIIIIRVIDYNIYV